MSIELITISVSLVRILSIITLLISTNMGIHAQTEYIEGIATFSSQFRQGQIYTWEASVDNEFDNGSYGPQDGEKYTIEILDDNLTIPFNLTENSGYINLKDDSYILEFNINIPWLNKSDWIRPVRFELSNGTIFNLDYYLHQTFQVSLSLGSANYTETKNQYVIQYNTTLGMIYRYNKITGLLDYYFQYDPSGNIMTLQLIDEGYIFTANSYKRVFFKFPIFFFLFFILVRRKCIVK